MVLIRGSVIEASPTDEQFRCLVMDAPYVVAILEADLTVRFVCRSVQEALGFSSEEVQGSNLKDYCGTGEVEGVLFRFRNLLEEDNRGALDAFELRLRHKDVSWRRFDTTLIDRLQDPGFQVLALYLRDVTEPRAYEHLLPHRALHVSLT